MEAKSLNGVITFAPTSRQELMQYAVENRKIMVAVNALKILHATDESRAMINSNLGYPDGFGAVWALQKKGLAEVVKIPGCELWLDVVTSYYQTKSFYLIGCTQDIIEETVNKLKIEFEGIDICNFRNGYITTEEEELTLIEDLKKHKPDVVFVAMGSPTQEDLMQRMQKSHKAVYQGLGGSFDVYTGHVKRAPQWWSRNNLEWAYRLLRQPSRITRQIHLVRFLVNLQLNRY